MKFLVLVVALGVVSAGVVPLRGMQDRNFLPLAQIYKPFDCTDLVLNTF